jgi:hypothetical protein
LIKGAVTTPPPSPWQRQASPGRQEKEYQSSTSSSYRVTIRGQKDGEHQHSGKGAVA